MLLFVELISIHYTRTLSTIILRRIVFSQSNLVAVKTFNRRKKNLKNYQYVSFTFYTEKHVNLSKKKLSTLIQYF